MVWWLLILPVASAVQHEIPFAESVRYHLPPDIAVSAGCQSQAPYPLCCPADTYGPARGELEPVATGLNLSHPSVAVQQCLRDTACYAAWPNLLQPGPCEPWQQSKVAIVQFWDSMVTGYAQHVEAVNAGYAARWGYTYIVFELALDRPCERSISWYRVEIARRLLSHHDVLFVLDADAIIVNHNDPWFDNLLTENKQDFLVCIDSYNVKPDKKIGVSGAFWVNAGAFIIRNSKWSHKFLNKWWDKVEDRPALKWDEPTEQATLGDWIYEMELKKTKASRDWLKHVKILAQNAFNSIDPFYDTFQQGQPVLHTTQRLGPMRQSLFAYSHLGMCQQKPSLGLTNAWMRDLTLRDALANAQRRPHDAEAMFLASSALKSSGREEESETYAIEGLRLRPSDMFYQHTVSIIHEKRGRLQEALQLTEQAIASAPMPKFLRRQAMLYQKMGRTAKAEDAWKALVDKFDSDPGVWFDYGMFLYELRKWAPATQAFEEAASLDPDHARAHLNVGVCFHQLSLFEKAVRSFDRVLAKPDQSDDSGASLHCRANIAKGNAYERLKESEVEAAQAFRQASLLCSGTKFEKRARDLLKRYTAD